LGGHAGHAGAAKAVEDDVAGVGVVQDVAHDRLVGHFGMVGVGVVDGVVLALGHVGGEGFAVIGWKVGRLEGWLGVVIVGRIVRETQFLAELSAFGLPAFDDFGQEGVGAGGVVGWVGEGQDVLVRADGEALDLAEFGVFQFLPQLLQVFGPLRLAGGLLRSELVGYQLGLVGHGYPFL
jgi:hypothetical protein